MKTEKASCQLKSLISHPSNEKYHAIYYVNLFTFQGGLTLPTRDHYLQHNYTQVVEALKKVMYRLIKLLIADGSDEGSDISIGSTWQDRIRGEINEVIDFETRLANITIPASQKKESGRQIGRVTTYNSS